MNRIPPIAQWVLLAGLAGFQIWFGLLPAFTRIDSDFPNYYTAARIAVHQGETARLYDDDWFQQQIFELGINQQGKFSPFPPTTILLAAPLAGLDPLLALRCWTVIGILLTGVLAMQLSKISGLDWKLSLTLVFLSGLALSNNFRLGQAYLLIAVSLALGLRMLLEGPPRDGKILGELAVGLFAGFLASIKYIPGILLVGFVLERRRYAVWGFALGVAIAIAASAALAGAGVWTVFFLQVLPGHLNGLIQNPYAIQFQSINTLLRTWFIADPLMNPGAPNFPFGYWLILTVCYAMGIWLAVRIWKFPGRNPDRVVVWLAFLLLIVLTLLPASATYHFLMLSVPMAVMVRLERPGTWAILSAYSVIGFLPYHLFRRFYEMLEQIVGGFALPVAFPRLLLLCAITLMTYALLSRSSNRSVQHQQ